MSLFKNDQLSTIYDDLVISRSSFTNALNDLSQENVKTILYMDFSNAYPTLTPRDNVKPTPMTGNHDYFCSKVIERSGLYSSHLTNFVIVDSPLFYIELFDQIQHRIDHANRVINARNDEALRTALFSESRKIPKTKEEIDFAIGKRIEAMKDTFLGNRLQLFREKIQSGSIRRLFDFYDEDYYYKSLKDSDIFDGVYSEINKFRRPSSSSDPEDIELHRLIDVYMVVSTIELRRSRNDRSLCYWGQDRLRKIFCDRQEELSRDATTPHIIIQSLLEAPHDRILKSEAIYNLNHRNAELHWLIEELLRLRDEQKVPITLAKAILNCRMELDAFLFAEEERVTPDDYSLLVRQISNRPARIKEAYERFARDAKSAEDIIKQVAGDLLNKEARQFLELRPNDRLRKLLKALDL